MATSATSASLRRKQRSSQEQSLLKAEEFLEEKMKQDLQRQIDRSRSLADRISELQRQRSQLEDLNRQHKLDWSQDCFEMEMLVNLGISTVFAKAKVPDCRKLFVECGLGFHVEMDLPQAIAFLEKKEAFLREKFDREMQETCRLKTQVHEMLFHIQSLQQALLHNQ
ncbi:unnamed protein product [Amoebophrya sp. A120]|nr:unnamed protein product [Amoebophrya sp. A120]|eukprot:GSA120T00025258001.1